MQKHPKNNTKKSQVFFKILCKKRKQKQFFNALNIEDTEQKAKKELIEMSSLDEMPGIREQLPLNIHASCKLDLRPKISKNVPEVVRKRNALDLKKASLLSEAYETNITKQKIKNRCDPLENRSYCSSQDLQTSAKSLETKKTGWQKLTRLYNDFIMDDREKEAQGRPCISTFYHQKTPYLVKCNNEFIKSKQASFLQTKVKYHRNLDDRARLRKMLFDNHIE